MGHSQFEKIPISKERQERLLHEPVSYTHLDVYKRQQHAQIKGML